MIRLLWFIFRVTRVVENIISILGFLGVLMYEIFQELLRRLEKDQVSTLRKALESRGHNQTSCITYKEIFNCYHAVYIIRWVLIFSSYCNSDKSFFCTVIRREIYNGIWRGRFWADAVGAPQAAAWSSVGDRKFRKFHLRDQRESIPSQDILTFQNFYHGTTLKIHERTQIDINSHVRVYFSILNTVSSYQDPSYIEMKIIMKFYTGWYKIQS